MRRFSHPDQLPVANATPPNIKHILQALWPYFWQFRWRLGFAFACLIAAKIASVANPLILREIIDGMPTEQALRWLPLGLLLAYGGLRFAVALFNELRELLFSRVTYHAMRAVLTQTFAKLHGLSLDFHLNRQTGAISRDMERGSAAIGRLVSFTVYSILPTSIEIALVIGILWVEFGIGYVATALVAITAYVLTTVKITNWRLAHRRLLNRIDSETHAKAIDSLINYETIKYFNAEDRELAAYNDALTQWEAASIKAQRTLSYLNLSQQAIIALSASALLIYATNGVVDGTMTLGDLVLVNTLLLQLFMPLNFLGVLYRELRQALTDIERIFNLIDEQSTIIDHADAQLLPSTGQLDIEFKNVSFAYDHSRQILNQVSFRLGQQQTVAIVGTTGSGKSTIARLLYRFFDPSAGRIELAGQAVNQYQINSLRLAIGVVPQEPVLFNETLGYNILIGRPDADPETLHQAIALAALDDLIQRLPKGLDTRVGERGLKLSGGEKQRVAIARVLLKNPAILVLDEATSAMDLTTEKRIHDNLIHQGQRTTLIIAHRLSTVTHADNIVVLEHGRVVEAGKHHDLLAHQGRYATLWQVQQRAAQQGVQPPPRPEETP